jgi:hypothetical protein
MCIELTVRLRSEDGEKSFTHKQLVYETIHLNCEGDDPDAALKPYIEEAIKQFGELPDSVRVTIKKEL